MYPDACKDEEEEKNLLWKDEPTNCHSIKCRETNETDEMQK